MSEVCGDDRFELIGKAKSKLLECTNIESRPEEVAVLDNVLFRCWQMGWLDQLRDDRSRYAELFGTPEKMAQTLAKALAECDRYGWHCDRCVYRLAPYCPRSTAGVASTADYDTILKWLRGDAE